MAEETPSDSGLLPARWSQANGQQHLEQMRVMSVEDSKHPQVQSELQPLQRQVLTPASADADLLPLLQAAQLQPVLQQEPTSAVADADSIPLSLSLTHAQAPEPEAPKSHGSVLPHARQSDASTGSPAEPEDDAQTAAPLCRLPAPDAAVERSSPLQQPQAVCRQEASIVAGGVDLPPLPPQPLPLRRQGSSTGQDDPTSASPPPTMLHPKESSLSREHADARPQPLSGQEPTLATADADCIPLPPPPCSITEQQERQRACSATDTAGPSGSSMQHAPQHELHPTATHEMGSAAPESQDWAGALLPSHAGSTVPGCQCPQSH